MTTLTHNQRKQQYSRLGTDSSRSTCEGRGVGGGGGVRVSQFYSSETSTSATMGNKRPVILIDNEMIQMAGVSLSRFFLFFSFVVFFFFFFFFFFVCFFLLVFCLFVFCLFVCLFVCFCLFVFCLFVFLFFLLFFLFDCLEYVSS